MMNNKSSMVLVVLALATGLFFFGCKDDTTDNPPAGPGAPTLNIPANNATDVAVGPTAFFWSSVSAATGYELHVATDAQFSNLVVNQDVGIAVTYSAASLNYGVDYYWEVLAHDADGNTSASLAFSFETIGVLIDTWTATPNSLVPIGIDSAVYNYYSNLTYSWTVWATGQDIPEAGTYVSDSDSLHYHATERDHVPLSPAENYARWYDLTQNNTQLLTHVLGEGSQGQDTLYTVIFVR